MLLKFMGGVYDNHFNKLLLAVIFLATILVAVHLMHKQDAGGNDAGFIVWAETQAAFTLGKLLSIMPSDAKQSADNAPAGPNPPVQP